MRKSFCLDSVCSFKDINSSPHNRSSSKQLWSFSKDSRFKLRKPYCESFYEKPSTFAKQGAAIGFGNKSDFTKDLTCSPGTKYNHDTIFDNNRKSKKGFTLNLARQKLPSKGYIPLQPLKTPSPHHYNNLHLNKGKSYSMRKKTVVIDKTMSIQSQNNNPGAKYSNPQALSPSGKYHVSKHKGTGATLFNPRRSVRFFQFKNQVPGPGKYDEVNYLSDRGHYPLSKSTGFGKRYFDKESRVVQFQQMSKTNYNPGPGSYRLPSEFGQYDGNVYGKTQYFARNKRY